MADGEVGKVGGPSKLTDGVVDMVCGSSNLTDALCICQPAPAQLRHNGLLAWVVHSAGEGLQEGPFEPPCPNECRRCGDEGGWMLRRFGVLAAGPGRSGAHVAGLGGCGAHAVWPRREGSFGCGFAGGSREAAKRLHASDDARDYYDNGASDHAHVADDD